MAVTGCLLFTESLVRADDLADLKAQMLLLQQKLEVMQQQLLKLTDQPKAAASATASAEEPKQQPADAATTDQGGVNLYTGTARGVETPRFFERKPGKSLTFYTGGSGGTVNESGPGEMTVYGNFDVSLDFVTKGLRGEVGPNGMPPVGNMGFLQDLSTNISYVGVRGFQPLSNLPFNFGYQLETEIDIASTSGTGETNNNESNVVKGGLTSRNSYIGLSSARWGSIKFGKSDAPLQALDGADESVFWNDRRLSGDCGKHGR